MNEEFVNRSAAEYKVQLDHVADFPNHEYECSSDDDSFTTGENESGRFKDFVDQLTPYVAVANIKSNLKWLLDNAYIEIHVSVSPPSSSSSLITFCIKKNIIL